MVVQKPPKKGTQTQLEDDDSPLEFPFEFEEDIFEDYGNTLILPIKPRPLAHTTPSDPHEGSIITEQIKSLSSIMS